TRDDVFLFTFTPGTAAAGVFTRSTTASADVDWCREALRSSGGAWARAVVANSGNSNAFTGAKGVEKNEATLAALVETLGVEKDQCYLSATGVIGEPLPNSNYVGEIVPELANTLTTPDWEGCARAFMTTDTFPKGAGKTFKFRGKTVNIAGIAKGSGMIAPNMGTMLAYLFTDAAVAAGVLQSMLARITERTFNCVTVDSDTSTSDTLMLFATGQSGAEAVLTEDDPDVPALEAALEEVCLDLAMQLVKDGEGATKFVSIKVEGAISDVSAKKIAVAIANSPLVKTALAAGDANWGRVVMAVGKSLEPIDQSALEIWFGDLQVAEAGGRSEGYDEARASAICAASEIDIRVSVGAGAGHAKVWTCDLTHGYVEINGAYRT
ncbi:UNVERIFIED_CONTAM: hypothetical protein GTU68_020945, partial [Idotea baltica]|nr:hypothetical protein [Idotea baltica]